MMAKSFCIGMMTITIRRIACANQWSRAGLTSQGAAASSRRPEYPAQLMIRDYLRHSDLHVTNKYLQATTKSKRLAQGKLVDAILPGGVLSGSKSTLIH